MENTNDLLAQAIYTLTPQGRAEINAALAQIQNCRNVRHVGTFCDIPSHDLNYAVEQLAQREVHIEASYWDMEITVKGLA